MKKSALVGAITLVALMPSVAIAQSDCDQDMKDMLEGTLDIAKHVDVGKTDGDSQGCTLASWEAGLSPVETVSNAPSHFTILVPSA